MIRIVRANFPQNPIFAETIARHPELELLTFQREDPASAWAALTTAHIYQISAARDELAPALHARAELLARCPNLLCVSSGGAGYDTVDVDACTAAGVLVVNQSGGNAQSVAEVAIGFMLDLAHRLSLADRRLRHDRDFVREDFMGQEITGATLGLVGLGNIGRRVARLASIFEMKVLAFDPLLDPATQREHGAEPVSLDELLARSDIVSVHCPRDPSTLRMFEQKAFAAMKPGAYFINTARGGIHDQQALLEALEAGHIAGAGLDVWEVEPPPLDDPLLHHPRVVATYHCAGVTTAARRRVAHWAAEQLVGLTLRGEKPPRTVNPEVWPRVQERILSLLSRPRP
jgi:D-3-phosphoglycerate dehydrogenase